MKDLLIGKIGKPFALKGEVKLIPITSFPAERFTIGREVELRTKEGPTLAHINGYRETEKGILLHFDLGPTINEIEPYIGAEIYMDKDEAPMPEGSYRYADLLGMEVYDEDGKLLGTIKDIQRFAPKSNLRIKGVHGKDFYVPFVDEFVKDIDIEKKKMTIHVIPGLL